MLANLQRQAIGGVAVSDFARHMAMTSPAFQAMETARKSLDRLLPALRNIDLSDFAKLESDELTTMHASDAIAQSVTPQDSLQESVDKIISAIQAQKEPTVQLILWLIFRKVMDWLIAGAIGAVMGYYAPTLLDKSPQAAKKTLEETVRTAIGASELLSEFRYVSNDLLIVRQNPRARSPEIGRLTFGKAVRLLKREKDFAFVVWTDIDSGAEIQGWVFSRYLGKFN